MHDFSFQSHVSVMRGRNDRAFFVHQPLDVRWYCSSRNSSAPPSAMKVTAISASLTRRARPRFFWYALIARVVQAVGHAPVTCLDGLQVKLECANAGRSLRDRIAAFTLASRFAIPRKEVECHRFLD